MTTNPTQSRRSLERLVRRWKREAINLRKEVSSVNLQLAKRTQYARLIAVSMAKHWSDTSPNFRPFDDLEGLLSQIDNMASGMERKSPNAQSSATAGAAGSKPEEKR